jgi:tellurite resistance protein
MTRTSLMIAALAQVAWADGVLRPGEALLFQTVIGDLELSDREIVELWKLVMSPPAIEGLDWSLLVREDAENLLRFSYQMASSDGFVCDEELSALRGLAAALGVEWTEALSICGHTVGG